jgi:hypothetical protein
MDYALRHIDPLRPPSSLLFRKLCQDGPDFPRHDEPKRIESSVPEVSDEVKREALEKLAKLRKEFSSYTR